MKSTPDLPHPIPDFSDQRRQYMEIYGSTTVLNNTLKVVVLCLSVICIGLVFAQIKTLQLLRNVKPEIVRIDELGRAQVLTPPTQYHPQEAEIKYFLIQFVQGHYSRIRATVRDDYARSLYLLEGRLADALIEANKKSKSIETFLIDQSDEIEIHVTSVSIEDLRKPPYRATVDFEKIYLAADHTEKRREKYIGNFVFTIRNSVTNDLIPINPLGFAITYFREDQTFQP